MTLASKIATLLQSLENARQAHSAAPAFVADLIALQNELPSGSGIDIAPQIDLQRSKPNRLVFTTSFHHMNENGYYDGWTDHEVIVTPCFVFGLDVKVTGSNRNDIKDAIAERFEEALNREVA